MGSINIIDDLIFVREMILDLAVKFKSTPTLFLNESDLQAELYTKLFSKYGDELEIVKSSVWGTDTPKVVRKVYTRRLHSELLLPEGRVDLAILDIDNIKIAVNSKGKFGGIRFENGNHIFIELKSSRTNRSQVTSKNKWFTLLFEDINKRRHYTNPSFLICFDFNGYYDEEKISDLQDNKPSNLEIFYFYSEKAIYYFK